MSPPASNPLPLWSFDQAPVLRKARALPLLVAQGLARMLVSALVLALAICMGLALLAGKASGQDAGHDAGLRRDVAVLADCAMDQLPDNARACTERIAGPCLEALQAWTLQNALACHQREEAAWLAWAVENAEEAAARLAMVDAVAPAMLVAAQTSWEDARDLYCALHILAWSGEDDGPLLQARCRLGQAAVRALELYWLARP